MRNYEYFEPMRDEMDKEMRERELESRWEKDEAAREEMRNAAEQF